MHQTTHLLFSVDEYQQRIAAIRHHMRSRNIDVLLIDQTEFLVYVTGFNISENMYRACLLPLEGEPVMILRSVDQGPFLEHSWLTHYVGFNDWDNPLTIVSDTVKQNRWHGKRIGIDEDSYCMTIKRFNHLKHLLPDVVFTDFSGVLEQVRACKSKQEIAYMREASRLADVATTEIVKQIGVGSSARNAATIAHQVFVLGGADNTRSGIFTSGTGDAFLHGNLHSHPMQEGDILHMELLPYVNGYSARMMRPVAIGKASDEQRHIAERLVHIQDAQFSAMKPGMNAGTLDAMIRQPVLSEGLRQTYVNISGYTIGYFPMSTPRTSDFTRIFLPNSDWELQAGMTFHMYISAAGIAFSETVLVTPTGIELLTNTPRQLFIA